MQPRGKVQGPAAASAAGHGGAQPMVRVGRGEAAEGVAAPMAITSITPVTGRAAPAMRGARGTGAHPARAASGSAQPAQPEHVAQTNVVQYGQFVPHKKGNIRERHAV